MKKILLINDCKFEAVIMKDKLIKMGYKVEICNEYGAFVKINKFNPDVIVTNFVMKDITGDELIEKIKIERPNTACILSSCDEIDLNDFIGKGVDETINTPVEEKELLQTVNRAILKYETHHSEFEHDDIVHKFKRIISFCPYCGGKFKHVNNSFLFCPYCGEKL